MNSARFKNQKIPLNLVKYQKSKGWQLLPTAGWEFINFAMQIVEKRHNQQLLNHQDLLLELPKKADMQKIAFCILSLLGQETIAKNILTQTQAEILNTPYLYSQSEKAAV